MCSVVIQPQGGASSVSRQSSLTEPHTLLGDHLNWNQLIDEDIWYIDSVCMIYEDDCYIDSVCMIYKDYWYIENTPSKSSGSSFVSFTL